MLEIQVPDIGDFDEVTVIELMVKPGDNVAVDQSLITVESDKASMEIPSSHAGVVKDIRVKLGDKVKQGSIVVALETAAADAAQAVLAPKEASKQAVALVPVAQPAINNVIKSNPPPVPVAAPAKIPALPVTATAASPLPDGPPLTLRLEADADRIPPRGRD